VTLYRGLVIDTIGNPFVDAPDSVLRVETDAALVVEAGRITDRGPYEAVRAAHPGEDVVDLRSGVLLPGLVDTHVHYPQVRAIGGLGMPLLDWLRECALPEEARLADRTYAAQVAEEFLAGLVRAGTTTALVFGSHFADAVDALFEAADRWGLRITAGQVVSDRVLRDDLLTTPARALSEGRKLIERWHGQGMLRYAVTPRFSLSASEPMLDACAELLAGDGIFLTSHINENGAEIDQVRSFFPERQHYLDTYAHHGLVTDRTILAHNVHPTEHELGMLAEAGAWVAHCPTSNAALGSGLFPLRRHIERGVGVALGSDVGAGTGFSLLKEGLQAYFAQQLLGPEGLPLTPAHLLYLATRAGAESLGLADRVGDLSVGKEFDAILLRPEPGGTLEVNLGRAEGASDQLARIFALGTSSDIVGVWVQGRRLVER
jgi:guanine deaminase